MESPSQTQSSVSSECLRRRLDKISCPDKLTVETLNKDYRASEGSCIPFQKLGYGSLELFLRSIPDTVQLFGSGLTASVRAVSTEKSKHIQHMILEQKKSRNGRGKGAWYSSRRLADDRELCNTSYMRSNYTYKGTSSQGFSVRSSVAQGRQSKTNEQFCNVSFAHKIPPEQPTPIVHNSITERKDSIAYKHELQQNYDRENDLDEAIPLYAMVSVNSVKAEKSDQSQDKRIRRIRGKGAWGFTPERQSGNESWRAQRNPLRNADSRYNVTSLPKLITAQPPNKADQYQGQANSAEPSTPQSNHWGNTESLSSATSSHRITPKQPPNNGVQYQGQANSAQPPTPQSNNWRNIEYLSSVTSSRRMTPKQPPSNVVQYQGQANSAQPSTPQSNHWENIESLSSSTSSHRMTPKQPPNNVVQYQGQENSDQSWTSHSNRNTESLSSVTSYHKMTQKQAQNNGVQYQELANSAQSWTPHSNHWGNTEFLSSVTSSHRMTPKQPPSNVVQYQGQANSAQPSAPQSNHWGNTESLSSVTSSNRMTPQQSPSNVVPYHGQANSAQPSTPQSNHWRNTETLSSVTSSHRMTPKQPPNNVVQYQGQENSDQWWTLQSNGNTEYLSSVTSSHRMTPKQPPNNGVQYQGQADSAQSWTTQSNRNTESISSVTSSHRMNLKQAPDNVAQYQRQAKSVQPSTPQSNHWGNTETLSSVTSSHRMTPKQPPNNVVQYQGQENSDQWWTLQSNGNTESLSSVTSSHRIIPKQPPSNVVQYQGQANSAQPSTAESLSSVTSSAMTIKSNKVVKFVAQPKVFITHTNRNVKLNIDNERHKDNPSKSQFEQNCIARNTHYANSERSPDDDISISCNVSPLSPPNYSDVLSDDMEEAIPEFAANNLVFQIDFPEDAMKFGKKIPEYTLPIGVNVGSVMGIFIAEVHNPFKFWFHLGKDENALDNLMNQMEQYYDAIPQNEFCIPKACICPGQVCAAIYRGFWHRGQILTPVFKNKAKVLFVDYGTVADVDINEIKYLLNEFGKIPRQAMRGTLAHLRPVDLHWDQGAIHHFLSLCRDVLLYGRVQEINTEAKTIYFILCNSNNNKVVNINKSMVDKGYALVDNFWRKDHKGSERKHHPREDYPTFDMLEKGEYPSLAELTDLQSKGIDYESMLNHSVYHPGRLDLRPDVPDAVRNLPFHLLITNPFVNEILFLVNSS